MSTRRDLWQLLWEVGASRRSAWAVLSKAECPYSDGAGRCVWRELSESDKRAIRDYASDLEIIVFVTLEDLGLPELAVE